MNQETFLTKMAENYQRNLNISKAKNSDYAGSRADGDAFANFRVIENLTNGGISVEQGILVRMTDKMQRITNLLSQEAQVKDESISDTLADLANYAMILKVYIDEKKDKKLNEEFQKIPAILTQKVLDSRG